MSKEERKRRELATNRLLELLRAREVADEEAEEKAKLEADKVENRDTLLNSGVFSYQQPLKAAETRTDEKAGPAEEGKVPTPQSLLEELAKVQSRGSDSTGAHQAGDEIPETRAEQEEGKKKKEGKVKDSAPPMKSASQGGKVPKPQSQGEDRDKAEKETAASVGAKRGSQGEVATIRKQKTRTPKGGPPSRPEKESDKERARRAKQETKHDEKLKDQEPAVHEAGEPEDTGLIQQIQSGTPPEDTQAEDVVQPEEIDSSLFSTLSDQDYQQTSKEYSTALLQIFNESRRRITMHLGDNVARYLQLKVGSKDIEVEKFGHYLLPYKTDDMTLSNMDELLSYIFEKELDAKEMKNAYGGVFSSKIQTKTHILQTPRVEKKELSDLVEWSAKKNLEFNPDLAIIDWEATPTRGDSDKHNVIMGIGERDTIENAAKLFMDKKLKLRLHSTLPILLWKLFVKNYPDRKNGCYVIVHIGESKTTVVAILDHDLVFTRDIGVGARDFQKAVMQRVVTGDKAVEIDATLAQQILRDHGIPQKNDGISSGSHVSLYKISIFLRPVIERMTGELSRSLSYLKKQFTALEIEELLFSGIGATFPHLPQTFGQNLNLNVALLNPLRKGKYKYKNGQVIPNSVISDFAVNFALASEEAQTINVLPKKLRSSFKYVSLVKVAALAAAFFLPYSVTTTVFSDMKVERVNEEIQTKSKQWNSLSVQAREYFDLLDDMDILKGFHRFLSNDRVRSRNQITVLKLLSSIIPKEIKFTSLEFKKEVMTNDGSEANVEGQEYKDVLEVNGFVQADASVSDIHLTNFMMQLEELPYFADVQMEMEEHSNPEEGKLFFTLNLRL